MFDSLPEVPSGHQSTAPTELSAEVTRMSADVGFRLRMRSSVAHDGTLIILLLYSPARQGRDPPRGIAPPVALRFEQSKGGVPAWGVRKGPVRAERAQSRLSCAIWFKDFWWRVAGPAFNANGVHGKRKTKYQSPVTRGCFSPFFPEWRHREFQ